MLIEFLGAVALCSTGLALVYRSWRSGNRWIALSGWTLTSSSTFALAPAVGAEFAVVYALSLPALLVWLFVAREASRLPSKNVASAAPTKLNWNFGAAARHTGLGVVLLVLLSAASLITAVAISRISALSGLLTESGAAALSIFLFPALWAVLMHSYLGVTRKLRLVVATLAASTGFMATAILMTVKG